jgi:hypothetical protein
MTGFTLRGACLCATVLLAIVGCSRSAFDSTVTGGVTLDGKTLGQGLVVFAQDGSNPATGTIGRDGSYTLKTSNMLGLKPGKYRASLSALDTPNPPPGVRDTTPPKQLVPEKYTSLETSGLEFEVKPGNNTFNIELKSK